LEKVKSPSASFDDVSATPGHHGTELDGTLRLPDGRNSILKKFPLTRKSGQSETMPKRAAANEEKPARR
jgi:hypothetical protein